MKIERKATTALLCLLLITAITLASAGCATGGNSSSGSGSGGATADEAASGSGSLSLDPGLFGVHPEVMHDEKNSPGFQLEKPEKDDTVAVIHTSLGDITIRFFPGQAPKAVTNFINLAKSGSYDKTLFHKVVKDFGIEGGHCGTDTSHPNGKSSYGGMFEDEFCDSLLNLRGAVSMYNTARDTNGSRFFINQTTAETFEKTGGWERYEARWQSIRSQLETYRDSELLSAFVEENGGRFMDPSDIPNSVKRLYEEHGGNPEFDGAYNSADRGYTVFGQVIDGMDVVDKITAQETDGNYFPLKPVEIKSIEVTEYK